MGNVTYERLDAMVTPKIYSQISLTPVLEHEGDFVRLHHIDVEWPVGEGVEKYVPIRYVSKHVARVLDLETKNDKLRELAGALLTSHEKMCTQRGHCFGCTFFYEEVKACPYVKISRTLCELVVKEDA